MLLRVFLKARKMDAGVTRLAHNVRDNVRWETRECEQDCSASLALTSFNDRQRLWPAD